MSADGRTELNKFTKASNRDSGGWRVVIFLRKCFENRKSIVNAWLFSTFELTIFVLDRTSRAAEFRDCDRGWKAPFSPKHKIAALVWFQQVHIFSFLNRHIVMCTSFWMSIWHFDMFGLGKHRSLVRNRPYQPSSARTLPRAKISHCVKLLRIEISGKGWHSLCGTGWPIRSNADSDTTSKAFSLESFDHVCCQWGLQTVYAPNYHCIHISVFRPIHLCVFVDFFCDPVCMYFHRAAQCTDGCRRFNLLRYRLVPWVARLGFMNRTPVMLETWNFEKLLSCPAPAHLCLGMLYVSVVRTGRTEYNKVVQGAGSIRAHNPWCMT